MRISKKTLWLLGLFTVFVSLFYLLHFKSPIKPSLPGSLQMATMEWDGYTRSYGYYVPKNLSAKPALVLAFHGSLGDVELSRSMYAYEFERLAEEHGFIVIYPEGYKKHFNGCRKTGPYDANYLKIDDVGFMRALVAQFIKTHQANPSAVFATGVSNGGQMALRLALEAPDLIAAAAPVATSLPTEDNMDCIASGKPVSFLLMNGTDDPMNPYKGGKVAFYGLFGDRGNVLSSVATAKYFSELAGLENNPTIKLLADKVVADNSTVQLTTWQDANNLVKHSVALYRIVGGGHGAPHPDVKMPKLLGGSNQDIVAAEVIWNFFEDTQQQ